MLKKEILKNEGLLSQKIRGEWVNKDKKQKAKEIVGDEKFSFEKNESLNYGKIHSLDSLFLQKGDEEFFAVKDVCKYEIDPKLQLLKGFSAKTGVELKFFNADFSKSFGFDDIFEKIALTADGRYFLENVDPNVPILVELQDVAKVNFDDGKFTLAFDGFKTKEQNETKEISILESMVDADAINKVEADSFRTLINAEAQEKIGRAHV